MPFPEIRRAIYKRNPLDNVICQLRFPPILKIDFEIPAKFQERIRSTFPGYLEKSELQIDLSLKMGEEVSSELPKQVPRFTGKNYEFSSEDDLWKINLTRTFIALSAKRYARWEEFLEKLSKPLNALIDIYAPQYFMRVGLRYINVIRRSTLNLSDIDWSELFKPSILGVLSSPELKNRVQALENNYEISLSDGESVVRIITALVTTVNDNEISYRIDNDFYSSKKTNIETAIEKLNYFNVRASRLIRWCITDRLHEAMEPEIL